MLAEIQRTLGDLSAKIGTLLSDMAYIREDVTEHKREIRALNGLPSEVSGLRAELAQVRQDFETRLRLLERDKMPIKPNTAVTLIVTVVLGFIGLLTYLGVSVK
jgi:outer membrane murein-binding lipoprotein Lpp